MKKLVALMMVFLLLFSFAQASADKIDINHVDLSTLSDAQLMTLRFRIDEKLGTKKSTNTYDLNKMSYWELIELKDKINLAIWQTEEWQEVTVPQGVWLVGEDIPVGHWTIKAAASYCHLTFGTKLDETGKDIDVFGSKFYHYESIRSRDAYSFDASSHKSETDFKLEKGTYIIVDGGSVIFTPYTGKPSLGFK